MGYSKQAFIGVSWMGGFRVFSRIIAIIRTVFLARILTPSQFGVFGIASLVLVFIELITETGINIFLVQENRKLNNYINTAWVVSIIRGIIIAGVIVLTAPFIVSFFNSPDAYYLLLLISIVPFLRGFINPAVITFQKNLEFKKEFLFKSTIFFVDSFTAVLLAFLTQQASSFVYGLIVGALVEVSLSFLVVRPLPKIQFEFEKVRIILQRGWWVTLTGIFSYIAQEGDDVVVGKLLGTGPLGIYQVAYKLSTLPITEITNVINNVVFPVYVKFSDDTKRLYTAFVKTTAISSLGAIILGAIIFILSEWIILFVLGQKWVEVVPLVRVLIIYGVLRTIFGSFAPVFLSIGRQDYVGRMTIVRMTGLLLTIIPFVMAYGLVGAGYSAVVSILVEVPIIIYYATRVFK